MIISLSSKSHSENIFTSVSIAVKDMLSVPPKNVDDSDKTNTYVSSKVLRNIWKRKKKKKEIIAEGNKTHLTAL